MQYATQLQHMTANPGAYVLKPPALRVVDDLTVGKHSRKISDSRSLTLQWPPSTLQKGLLLV
jgi:hypothetical protein